MSNYSHGCSKLRGYQSWDSMRRRCSDPAHKDYSRYGAKGITYPAHWENAFNFFKDMGEAPLDTSLDRIDLTKGYSKENCRWATVTQQQNNKTTPRNNGSGCKGVSWQAAGKRWLVSRMFQGRRTTLYWGTDFFLACAAAKSWDNAIKTKIGL